MPKKSKGIVSGIAIAVIVGIILFTFQQGYLQFGSGPDLFVNEVKLLRQAWVDSETPIQFTIVNEGEQAAQNCNLFYTEEIESDLDKSSVSFSVISGSSEPVEIRTGKYEKAGDYLIDYVIKCANYEGQPDSFWLSVKNP